MTNLLKLRVASEAFAQTFAYVVGWLMMSIVTTLALTGLLLTIVGQTWGIVLGASVLVGCGTLATITYRGLQRVRANVGSR